MNPFTQNKMNSQRIFDTDVQLVKYKVLKEDLGKEVVGVGFRKDDKEFAARIDKILDEMKKDGTCKKISMQWFGTDITRYEDKK